MCDITRLGPWYTLPHTIWAWKRLGASPSGPMSWTAPFSRLGLPRDQRVSSLGLGTVYHYTRGRIFYEAPKNYGLFCYYSLPELFLGAYPGSGGFYLPANTWLVLIPPKTPLRRAYDSSGNPSALLTMALMPLEPVDAYAKTYLARTNKRALAKWADAICAKHGQKLPPYHHHNQKEYTHV